MLCITSVGVIGIQVNACTSISNVNNDGIKEPTYAYQKCAYVKVRKYLYTPIVICVNTILNHIKTMVILPMHEDFVGYIDLNVLKQ